MARPRCLTKWVCLGLASISFLLATLGMFQFIYSGGNHQYTSVWEETWGDQILHDGQVSEDPWDQHANLSAVVIEEPIILWWTPFTGGASAVRQCGHHKCFFTQNRGFKDNPKTKVFLFYGSDFKPTDLPLPRLQRHQWALLHEESPKNNMLFSHKKTMLLFNHTSTFRRESDFPLTLQHLESLDVLTSTKYYVPLDVKNSLLRGRSNLAQVAYVHSDCDAPSERDNFVKELMKYIQVDSYGSCLHNKDLPKHIANPLTGMEHPDFYRLMAQYKFTLAFENAICQDYITEKLWRPLELGSLPIYYGSPTVQDWLPNKKSAIIVQDFNQVQELAKLIGFLNGNNNEYLKYFKHKLNASISNSKLVKAMNSRTWKVNDFNGKNFVEEFECFICKRILTLENSVRAGFHPIKYQAKLNHYGCPIPESPFPEVPVSQGWWVELYNKAQLESEVLYDLVTTSRNFTGNNFSERVLSRLQAHQPHYT